MQPGTYCTHCGSELRGRSRYCTNCGAEREKPPARSAPIDTSATVVLQPADLPTLQRLDTNAPAQPNGEAAAVQQPPAAELIPVATPAPPVDPAATLRISARSAAH